jgi:hypothetical protein
VSPIAAGRVPTRPAYKAIIGRHNGRLAVARSRVCVCGLRRSPSSERAASVGPAIKTDVGARSQANAWCHEP